MKHRYKECRTIKTGDYENHKIEYEIESENMDENIIGLVQKALDVIEMEVRKKDGEIREFQRIINDWIGEKEELKLSRLARVKEILLGYGADKLKELPISFHEEFLDCLGE